ncbi:DUF4347 domain-containing protein [Pseudomonas sp. PDNC002]|uniref:DUF4347 domain-containing protein n=1 Tax=Pseudomonas sp. PDNC002 TaxID=2811422 RepID=UPI001F061666|nr:DUF4347 domain-containing protein [Pseudomonas sp. PDNC002]
MMFDGAVAATVADAAASQSVDHPAGKDSTPTDQPSHDSLAAAPAATSDQRHEVVFVDSKVANYQQLVANLKPGTEVVVLDGNKDGLQQIAQYLNGRSGIDAIHILSHGEEGEVHLGSTVLSADNLASKAAELSAIGDSLDADGDILIYGCDVAKGSGDVLLQQLSALTRADVAASTDRTGAAALGGNWTLEAHTGSIETQRPWASDSGPDYADLLALPSATQSLSNTYWTNNTGGNTVDGFTLSESTGATRASSPNSIYYSTSPALDGDNNYYYQLTWTADNVDLGKFDLDGMVIQSFGGHYRLDFSAVSGGVTVTQSFEYQGAQGPLTINIDSAQFNDISAFTVRVTNLSGSTSVANIDLQQVILTDLKGPNADPVLGGLNGKTTSYTEGSADTLIDAGGTATVSDSDSANFDGGQLLVSISSGRSTLEDVLGIRNQGTGAGQIAVAGSNVLYGGVVIGTYTGGTYNNDLVVTFNSSATAAAAQALVRNLIYRNTNGFNPSEALRTISVSISDGDGGTSVSSNVTLTLVATNDAPILSPANSVVSYTEKGADAVLNSGLMLADDGNSFLKATVTISDVRSGDILNIGNLNGFSATYNGATGVLTITGSGNAAALQATLRSVSFSSLSNDPTLGGTDTSRQITFVVTDSSGADSNVASTQVSIAAVNDAPTLSGGPYTWTGTSEDLTSQVRTVGNLLAGLSYADADGPDSGIALTATSGNGTWQYSTDGATWTDIGAVSNTSALLLSFTTQLRYVPDGRNGEAATLSFRAWDTSLGNASTTGTRSTADTTTNGGTTAFSTGTAQASIQVSNVNDAPVLIPIAPTLNGLTDGDINNVGQAVSSFITGHVSDVDSGAMQGIALTDLNSGLGTWQYSVDGGASWQNVGGVSAANALLLRSSDRVRFLPDGVNGTTASFTFKAWDQSGTTAGQQGFKVDASSTGGATPFSVASDTASVTVTAINDAPSVTGSSGSTSWVEGNNVDSTPVVIDSGLTITDADGPYLAGAKVTVTNFHIGEDQLVFTGNAATMGNITGSWDASLGVLYLNSAGNQATLAQWQAALSSVAYLNLSDTPTTATRSIEFQVTDGGGLSSSPVTRNVTITAVDDSPIISATPSTQVVEDVATVISQIVINDSDSYNGTVTLSVGSGTLSAISGGGVTVGGTSTALTLTGSLSAINLFIAAHRVTYTTAANATSDVTLNISVDSGSVSTASTSMLLVVTPVNDAPVASVPGSILVTEDVASSLTGISFSDVDAGSGVVIASFSVPNGTLSASSGGGVTVLNSGTAALTLSGSLSDINTFIASGNLHFLTARDATSNVTLTVTINDNGNSGGGALTDSKTVTLNVVQVNDAPVNSVPGSQTVLQNGTLVFSTGQGNLISISDVDASGNSLSVTLTASNGLVSLGSTSGLTFTVGSGFADGLMTFTGSLADINAALNGMTFQPTPGYHGGASLQIVSNDQGASGTGGAKSDSDVILITIEQPNPRIVGVSAGNPDGSYKVGDQILVLVQFDQSVFVNLNGGVPSLLLETGLVDRNAIYVSGSGTNTLTFLYTVQAGDVSADLDFQSTTALQLNGSALANAASDPAILTLPAVGSADSLGGRSDIVIDGVAPTVTSVGVPSNGSYVAGQNLDFTVNFSENVVVDTSGGTPRIAVTLDSGGTVFAQYLSGSGTSALVFRLVVANGHLDTNGIGLGSSIQANGGTLRDGVGNAINGQLNSVASTSGVLVDAVAPTVSSVNVPVGVPYNAGDTLTFVVNASEAVVVNGVPRLALDIGGTTVFADYVAGSGSSTLVFQYTIQAGDNDADGISVTGLSANGATLRDAAGNGMDLTLNNVGSTSSVIVDTVAPTPSAIVTLDPSPSNAGSVRYTVTFSEDVNGVDLSDFALVGTGTASGSLTGLQQIDARTYQVTISGVSGTGTLGLNLNGSATGIVDGAGNPISGGLTGAVYAIDRDAPTVTAVSVPPNALHKAGDTLEFVVQTSEAVLVDGSPKLAIDMGGRTVFADYVSGSGGTSLVFRYTVQAGDNDGDGIQVVGISSNGGSLHDATGNALNPSLNGVGDSHGVLVDTRAPTATGAVRLDPSPTGANTLGFLVTFDEDVSGVDAGDFSLVTSNSASGSILSVVQLDARIYRVTVGGVSGQGSLGLTVNAGGIRDAAGNALGSSLRGDSYVIGSLSDGDPEFRITTPPVPPMPSQTPLQPNVPVVVTPQGTSPVIPSSLFQPDGSGGLPPLGDIFIQNGAPSQSFIAQVFGNASFGDGSAHGFLGFGGGDGGVFGSSTLSGIFDRDGFDENTPLKAFDRRSGDIDQGIRGVFGAPSLAQQLEQINESEQQPLRELAWALGQVAQGRDAS